MSIRGFLCIFLLLFIASPALATNTVLSGMFDGSEAQAPPLHDFICEDTVQGYPGSGDLEMAYITTGFTASTSGSYTFYNGLWSMVWQGAMPAKILLYQQSFDPADSALNLVASQQQYQAQTAKVELTAGTDYVLVVQRFCSQRIGSWVVAFDGPGTIHSDRVVTVPSFTSGRFAGTEPNIYSPCSGNKSPYKQVGPVQVSRTGTYYFVIPDFDDSLAHVCLVIYSAPPDAAKPEVNQLAWLTCCGSAVDLVAGSDYYLVVQKSHSNEPADYSFTFIPPAQFRINRGISDVWVNPGVPGQGVVLDVLEQRNEIQLGWISFAPEQEKLDQAGQRWLTASGPFAGTRAELQLEWTRKPSGASGDADPLANGQVELNFDSCSAGTLSYSWNSSNTGQAPMTGSMPLRRIAPDSIALCESSYRGPGMAGPL